MKSLITPVVAVLSLTMVLFAQPAGAEPQATEKPAAENQTQTPAETPAENPAQRPPECNQEYILSYITTARLINASAPYFEVGEIAPSLPETAYACHRFAKNFPETTACLIPQLNVVANSEALKDYCSIFTEGFVKLGGSLEVKEVNEQTPFGLLDAKSMRLTIRDADAFKKLFADPMKTYVVAGKVLTLMEAIESPAKVRCGIDYASPFAATMIIAIGSGQTFQGTILYESFVSGVRATHFILAGGLVGVVCTKTAGGPMTFGELKKAFGPIADFEYSN